MTDFQVQWIVTGICVVVCVVCATCLGIDALNRRQRDRERAEEKAVNEEVYPNGT